VISGSEARVPLESPEQLVAEIGIARLTALPANN
jgi:hypothetical protein